MSKFRPSILIIGMLLIVVAASLFTVFALYITGAVVTERIELVYAVSDEEKVYDGTPLLPEKYELISGEMQKGHYAEVQFSGSQTDAGESKSSLSVRICDEKGYDVTNEYKIGVNSGLLKVTPKDISVTLNDEEVTYNGTKVSFENYTITQGELVTGHKIAGSQNVQLISVNDTLPSDLKAVVFDAAGKDVTANYNVDFTMGRIKVVPRSVTVKPVNVIKVYDGVEVDLKEIEIISGSLADGQYIKKIEINYGDTRFIDVCDQVTRITKLAIYQNIGSSEIDVTENYDLDTSETGILRIEKRKLTVTAKSESWEYDGFEHNLKYVSSPLSCEGLAAGEQIERVEYSGSITDVGTESSIISRIYFSEGASAKNYEIAYIAGTLTVTKREVTIITPSVSKTYDGTPLEGASEDDGEEPYAINLADYQKVWYDGDSLPSRTDCGTSSNDIACIIVDESDETKDLSYNYHITWVYGSITVTKRPVKVSTPSKSKVFDGDSFTGWANEEDIDTDNLVNGHGIRITSDKVPEISGVDRIYNTVEVAIYYGEDNVTKNYDIDYQYGTLEITRLNITVRTASERRAYDGTEWSNYNDTYDEKYFSKIPELLQSKLNCVSFTTILDVSTETNEVIYELTGVDADNYWFDYQYGTLEVTPFNFDLYLKDYNLTYGDSFNLEREDALDGNDFPDGGFLTADDFDLEYSQNFSYDAGSYSYRAKLADGVNAANFNIKYTGGSIIIQKCGVLIDLRSYPALTYNGMVQTPDVQTSITISDLDGRPISRLNADLFRVVTSNVVKNAGTYTYTVKFIDSSYERNYTLYVNDGDITISKCPINITLPNDTTEYNGLSQLPAVWEVIQTYSLPNGLTPDDFKIVSDSSAVNASANPYYYTVQMIDSREAENYEINVTRGSITINKLPVWVELKTYNIPYDGQAHLPSLNDLEFEYDDGYITDIAKYFELTTSEVFKDAKTYYYGIRFLSRADSDNIELNVGEDGEFTITKFKAQLLNNVGAQTKTYDGKIFSITTDKATLLATGAIPFTYTISVTYETDGSNATMYQATYKNLHIYGSGGDITHNIEITGATTVQVNIKKRDIAFTLSDYFCSSNNVPTYIDPQSCLGISSTTPFISGFRIDFSNVYIDISTRNNTLTVYDFTSVKIYNEEGSDVTANFNLPTDILTSSLVVSN